MDLQKISDEIDHVMQLKGWGTGHSPKNLIMALTGEVGELNEVFQWDQSAPGTKKALNKRKLKRAEGEVADIFVYLLLICKTLEIDLESAVLAKLVRVKARKRK